MMRNRKVFVGKKIVSFLLAFGMVLSIIPITAFAKGVNYIDRICVAYTEQNYKAGDTPQASASVTEGNCTVAYEYWKEIYKPEEGGPWHSTGRYWYSDEEKMTALPENNRITQFEAGHHYTYSIVLKADRGYFISNDTTNISVGNYDWGTAGRDVNLEIKNLSTELYIYNVHAIDIPTDNTNYVIDNVIINNAPTSCTVGETPKATAEKGDNGEYTFCEYWEEWAETENGLEPVKFWYSDAEQMNRVPADQRITTFEDGKTYSYSIIAKSNEDYAFASKDDLSVILNSEDFTDKSGAAIDGKILMIGPGAFMTPIKTVTQKEIEMIEINNATVSFKAGDKPVFTGTTPDESLYAIDYEGWFGEDDEFISSSDYWNNAFVERDWCDGLISSLKANTEYTYFLYLKLTDEAVAQGYVFGPNTKLKVNGKNVDYPHESAGIALQVGTDLTMTPTTSTTQKEIPVVEINNATLTFSDGDKPVFTGTTPNDAPYALVFEEWRTDGEWTRSDEWFNDDDHHDGDKVITAFDKNKIYNYNLYLKTTAEGSEDGWYFGQNTKLKINGEEVSLERDTSDNEQQFTVTTGIAMTPVSADAPEYKIIDGANGTWTQKSGVTLSFRANGDFSKFTGVNVDGTLIDSKNYTAVSGSTVITLKADYLKTLSVGTHKLTVVYSDGECSTNFEVKKAVSEQIRPTAGEDKSDTTNTDTDTTTGTTQNTNTTSNTTSTTTQNTTTTSTGGNDTTTNPETGNNSNMFMWVALLFVSGYGIIVTTVYGKKKSNSKQTAE